MNLPEELNRIADAKALDRADVIEQLKNALLEVADRSWGRGRKLEATYEDGADAVAIYQVVQIVEQVSPARALVEMDLAAGQDIDAEAEIGDEFLVQVFYRDEDATAAKLHAEKYPPLPRFEELAQALPCPERPEWMRDLWPQRRHL